MAEQTTYIKIDRNLKRWRWYKNKNTLIVFLTLLLDANVVDHEFEGEIIHRGEVATSLGTLCMSTSLTNREVRTAISHLKMTGEVTSRQCHKFQVITITNYDKYQDNRQAKRQANRHPSDRQATGKRQQYKNDNNDKHEKKYIPPKSPKGDLTPSEPIRGTDEFRNKSHLLLTADEGTADDIPMRYRDQFKTFADYWGYRNQ